MITGPSLLDLDDTRAALAELLPTSMTPAALRQIASIPLTRNGKTDMPSVQRLLTEPVTPFAHRAANSATEAVLIATMHRLVGVEVGPDDDLLAAGIDSVNALRIRSELMAQGLALDVKAVFSHPTIAALCAAVTPLASDIAATDRRSERSADWPKTLPLLPVQRSLLAASLAEPHSATAIVQEVQSFVRPLDAALVAAALQDLVTRHDALRGSPPRPLVITS